MKTNLRETLSAPVLSPESAPATRYTVWGIVLGIVGAVLYSLKAIFVKLAYLPQDGVADSVAPITLMMLRMGFSFPVYMIILAFAWSRSDRKPKARQICLAMCAGVLAYYVCTWLDFTGLQYITAQLERLLLFTYPAFVILFGALFFGGRLTLAGLGAVGLAYSGLAVVFLGGDITVGDHLWLGTGLILATAMLFALFQLLAKTFIDRMGAQLFTCLAMIGAFTAILTHFILQASLSQGVAAALDLSPRIFVLGATIAVFSTLLPSFFINIAIGRIGAQKVAMLGMIGPLATVVAAILVLGEPFGIWDGVGTAVTIAGIALYMWIEKRPQPSKAMPRAR